MRGVGAGRYRGRASAVVTPRWVAVHLAVLGVVVTFLGLGWWQINRAAAGNLLSYGYAVQWPAFAAFVVWVWIVEMRKVLRTPTDAGPVAPPDEQIVRSRAARPEPTARAGQPAPVRRRPRNEAAYDDSDDPHLAAYNHYLAWLNTHPHLTPADYPGVPAATTKAKEKSL